MAIRPLFPGRIGIWKCWFLWMEKNRSTRRKTLGAGTRTNNKLNPHMTPSPGIEPGPHWWEASALSTGPPLLPQAPCFVFRAVSSLLCCKTFCYMLETVFIFVFIWLAFSLTNNCRIIVVILFSELNMTE